MAKNKKILKENRFNPTLFNYTAKQLNNALEAVKKASFESLQNLSGLKEHF